MGTAAVVLSVIAALAVGGILGLAIGWKVEQQRVKDDVKNIRPVATVTSITDNSMKVALKSSSGNRTYVITDTTKVDPAADGSANIAEGDVVIVKSKRVNGKLQATEVVILPEGQQVRELTLEGPRSPVSRSLRRESRPAVWPAWPRSGS